MLPHTLSAVLTATLIFLFLLLVSTPIFSAVPYNLKVSPDNSVKSFLLAHAPPSTWWCFQFFPLSLTVGPPCVPSTRRAISLPHPQPVLWPRVWGNRVPALPRAVTGAKQPCLFLHLPMQTGPYMRKSLGGDEQANGGAPPAEIFAVLYWLQWILLFKTPPQYSKKITKRRRY